MKEVTLAIVGRPNVGKSTLFNVLTKTRQALVVDTPGVTRDRLYGQSRMGDAPFSLIDTCGIFGEQSEVLLESMHAQLQEAIVEADAVLFMVDARAGLMPDDRVFAGQLREQGKTVYVVANKTDGLDPHSVIAEFYQLGFDDVIPISASHKRGVVSMMDKIAQDYDMGAQEDIDECEDEEERLKIAVLGRPNVGKSTLINRMLKEDRVVVYDMPGTTRDSIYIPLDRYDKKYTLIDTAGVRRQSRVYEVIEKFSVIKAKQAVMDSGCVIMVLNAQEEIYDQDLTLLRYIYKVGRALVIAVNKWDSIDLEQKIEFKENLKRRLNFIPKVRIHTISALHGTGVGDLFDLANEANAAATQDLTTSRLTALLEKAVSTHQPPLSRGRRIRLKYAHCTGHNPLKIFIHGNQTECLPDSYKKYLHNYFLKQLELVGAQVHLVFKTSENPFKGKRNLLTERQLYKRRRLMKHHKSKS